MQDQIGQIIDIFRGYAGEPSDHEAAREHLRDTASRLFLSDLCNVYLINPITGDFLKAFSDLKATSFEVAGGQPSPNSTRKYIIDHGEIFIPDLSQQAEFKNTFTASNQLQAVAGVCLRTRQDKTLAVLFLNYKQTQTFDADFQKRLREFANQSSRLLENTWSLRRYVDTSRIAKEINQGFQSPAQLFATLTRYVRGIVDTRFTIMLVIEGAMENTLDYYWTKARPDGKPFEQATLNQPRQAGACEWVMNAASVQHIRHYSRQQHDLPFRVVGMGSGDSSNPESLIFVPLMLHNRCLGVLSVQHPQPNAYNGEDVQILNLLANHIATAIDNERLIRNREALVRNLNRLNDVGQTLIQQLDQKELLARLVGSIREATESDLVILYPYSNSTGEDQFDHPTFDGVVLDPDLTRLRYSSPDDINRLVVRAGKPTWVEDSNKLYELLGGDKSARRGNFEAREKIKSTVAVPLQVGTDETVGVLYINYRNTKQFDAGQQQLIAGLASYSAIAIKNARTFGLEQKKRFDELELLRQIDMQIKAGERTSVLDTIVKFSAARFSASRASILLYNPRLNRLETKAAEKFLPGEPTDWWIDLDDTRGLTLQAFRSKKTVLVPDVREDVRYKQVSPTVISELDVPLLNSDRAIGVLCLQSEEKGAFTLEDEQFATVLAGQAVVAIKLDESYQSQVALSEVSRVIANTVDYEKVFEVILEQALELSGARHGIIFLHDQKRNDLHIAAQKGVSPDDLQHRISLDNDEGVVSYVWMNRERFHLADREDPEWKKRYVPLIPGMRYQFSAVLKADNREMPLGVITLESPDKEVFNERDEQLVPQFADLAVVAIQNAERLREAEEGRRRLNELHRVDEEIIKQSDDPDHVIRTVLASTMQLIDAESADLHRYQDGTIVETYFAKWVENETELRIVRVLAKSTNASDIVRSIIDYVASTRISYLTFDDAQNDPRYQGGPDIHSELAVPMISGKKELVGVLNLESTQMLAFDEDDKWIVELLAGQAVIALQSAENFARAQLDLKRFKALYTAASALSEATETTPENLEYVYQTITKIAHQQSGGQVVIRRFNPTTQDLHVEHYIKDHPIGVYMPHMKLGEGANGMVAQTRRTKVWPDVQASTEDVDVKILNPDLERSLVVAPVVFGEKLYGTLELMHDKPNHFSDADKQLYATLASQLGLTLHRLETLADKRDSERRANDLRTLGALGQQAFGVAHRFSNDLKPIEVYATRVRNELAKTNPDNMQVNENLDNIINNISQSLKLISELRDRLDSLDKNAEAPRKQSPVRSIIQDAIDMPALPRDRIVVDVASIGDYLHVEVVFSQVAEAVRNLVENAWQAIPDKGTVSIRTKETASTVEIEVEDTGKGIKEGEQKRIFGLFVSSKGTFGFGLWSARQTALAHGGSLELRWSEPGKGSCFVLGLPKPKSYT